MITVTEGVAPGFVGVTHPRAYKLGEDSAKGVKGLAVTQIVMGILCIVFEIVMVALYHSELSWGNTINGYVAPGIWNGAFILVIGIIGVLTAARNTRGWIITYMILNIIAAVEMPTFISMAGIATGQSAECTYAWYWYKCPTYAPLALNILNLLMAFSQFIITIVAASLCCGPACCNSTGRVHTTMVVHGHQQQQAMTTMVVGNQAYTFGQNQSGSTVPQGFVQQPVGYGYGGAGVVQPPAYHQQQFSPAPDYYSQQPANSGPPPQPQQQPITHPQKY